MKLTSPSNVRSVLDSIGLSPSRFRGQNFLIDRNILDIIISTAGIEASDSVLEIGPGLGVVTEELLKRAKSVTAVEIDRRLCAYLGERFRDASNLRLICSDVMRLDLGAIAGGGRWKVAANLPYSVASRVLVDLARVPVPPDVIVTTVQLEVARRLAAEHGESGYGALSIWVQGVYKVAIRKVISPSCFWPAPKVESAVVRMEYRGDRAFKAADMDLLNLLVQQAFMQRRKQMGTIAARLAERLGLRAESCRTALAECGIDPAARPEDVDVAGWYGLADSLTSKRRAD